jgi:hypothetical protein
MILSRFMRRSTRPGPRYMIRTIWAGYISSQHELGIDLSIERQTRSRALGQRALWSYLTLEEKCRCVEYGVTAANAYIGKGAQIGASLTLRIDDWILVISIEGCSARR